MLLIMIKLLCQFEQLKEKEREAESHNNLQRIVLKRKSAFSIKP